MLGVTLRMGAAEWSLTDGSGKLNIRVMNREQRIKMHHDVCDAWREQAGFAPHPARRYQQRKVA